MVKEIKERISKLQQIIYDDLDEMQTTYDVKRASLLHSEIQILQGLVDSLTEQLDEKKEITFTISPFEELMKLLWHCAHFATYQDLKMDKYDMITESEFIQAKTSALDLTHVMARALINFDHEKYLKYMAYLI